MSQNSHAALLGRSAIFGGLSTPELAALAARMKLHRFDAGAFIVGQDEAGDSLFVVVDGRVKVTLLSESGREVILSVLRAGDAFGEMSLLDGEVRSASVVALDETTVLVLERSAFVRHIQAHPDTALAILRVMSQRLREADRVIGNLALLDVYGRVARFLHDLGEREGDEVDEGTLLKDRPTHQEIASMVGTSRETVSRVLGDFARRGLIVVSGKQVLLRHAFDVGEFTSE
jgi:CRP-like cAMP-binding protein